MKKGKLIAFACIIAASLVLYLYFKPVNVHKVYDSVIYSFDSDIEYRTSIELDGQLYRDLFGKDKINGNLIVDKDRIYKVQLKYDGSVYFYHLVSWDDSKALKTLGTIQASKNLDKFWIKLNDIDKRYQLEDSYVFGPAHTKEEAEALVKQLMKSE